MNSYLIIGLPLFLIALMHAILGSLALLNNPHKKNLNAVVAFLGFNCSIYCLFVGLVYVRAAMGLDFDFYYRACHIGWFGIPALFQITYYIKDDRTPQAWKVAGALYFFWGLLFVLNLTTDWFETGVQSLIPFVDRYGPLERPMRFVGGMLLIVLIMRLFQTRREVSGLKKLQINYFILGSVLFATGGALGAGFLQLFGGAGLDPALVAYFSVPWVLLTFYAITRYRLFDIQIILSAALTVTVLTFGMGLIHVGLFKLLAPSIGSTWAILVGLCVTIIVFLNTPLITYVQGSMDDVVLKNKYQYQNALKKAFSTVISILNEEELVDYLLHVIQQSLKIHKAALFLKDSKGDYILHYERGFHKEIAPSHRQAPQDIIGWLKTSKQIFIKPEQQERLTSRDFIKLYGPLEHLDAELAIPLIFKDQLIGVLTLGPKDDDRPYSQSDIKLLETLGSQTAIAIENALAQAALRESEERFRLMADSAPVFIWLADESRAVTWVNKAWLDFTGSSLKEEIGEGWMRHVHAEDRQRLNIYVQAFNARQPFKMEYRSRRHDGEYRWILVHGIPRYEGGQFVGYIGSCIDITERMVILQSLEDKTRSLENTNKELEQFAYIASHDLQEPLHVVNSFADLLALRCAQKLDPKEKEYLQFIRQSATQAKTLIRELLEYSRIGRGDPFQPVDLQAVLKEVEAMLRFSIEEAQARIEYEALPCVHARYLEMVQLFQNLISNAVKYRREGEPVVVRISWSKTSDTWLFAVQDNGIGIDIQYKDKIFAMFQRLHSKSEYSGTGIGLAICKKIVEQHGGKIWVESAPGVGSTFYFTLKDG